MFHLKKTKIFRLACACLFTSFLISFVVLPERAFATPPRCYNFDGSDPVPRDCQIIAGSPLEDDKCYTERRSGPNGTLNGYIETSCDDPTDRDQDGNPGGAGSTPHKCGGGNEAVGTTFNIGCKGIGNPIIDMLFALIRFLSAGVGIVLVGSMIVTGIQHTLARDKPEATANLIKRLLTLAGAIVLYALAFALLNYLIPGGLLI